jgi:transcriptional regulator with XRE-family HTH domain
MIVNSSTQIRVIRTWLGTSSRDFSARLGVCPASLTNWERGRATPGPEKRKVLLAELCQEYGIGFPPSGMPVPFAFFTLKPGEFTGWDSSFSPKAECALEGDDSRSECRLLLLFPDRSRIKPLWRERKTPTLWL